MGACCGQHDAVSRRFPHEHPGRPVHPRQQPPRQGHLRAPGGQPVRAQGRQLDTPRQPLVGLDPVRRPAPADRGHLEPGLDRLVSLAAVAVVLVFMMVNPLLFRESGSTRNWASMSVFGEHIWSDRDTVELPPQFVTSKVPAVAIAIQVAGVALLAYGLIELDLLTVAAGLVLAQTAKAWYLDRMVLLYEDMKTRNPEYAAWER